MQEKERNIQLSIDGVGRGSLVIDGKDVSNHVAQTIISSRVGEPTRVTVVMHTLNFTADVRAHLNVNTLDAEETTTMQDEFRRYPEGGNGQQP